MTLSKTQVDLDRMTPRERKSYQNGMAEVARKLAGHRKPTAKQLESQTLLKGRAAIAHKLGALGYKKHFGTLPPAPTAKPAVRTLATSTPAKATVAKSPAPTAPASPPAGRRELIRHFSVARGLF